VGYFIITLLAIYS